MKDRTVKNGSRANDHKHLYCAILEPFFHFMNFQIFPEKMLHENSEKRKQIFLQL